MDYWCYCYYNGGKILCYMDSNVSVGYNHTSMRLEQLYLHCLNMTCLHQPPRCNPKLLYDPVIIASGKTFGRVWIKKWFNEGNQMCPVTNTKLKELCLTPNLAMKALISKRLLRHGINVPQHAKPVPSLLSLRKPSSSSIASFGSSVLRMQLELGSTESSIDSSNGNRNDDIKSRLPQAAADSHSRRYHHSSKISSSGVHAACVSELDQYSWNSQCKAVENVKGLLEDNDKALHLTFSNSHVTPVIKFLKDANEICDIKMQKMELRCFWRF